MADKIAFGAASPETWPGPKVPDDRHKLEQELVQYLDHVRIPDRNPTRDLHHQHDRSVNSVIRKVIRKRKFFPSQQSAIKIIYLAIAEAQKRWTRPIRPWNKALQQLATTLGDRFSTSLAQTKKQQLTQSL